DCSHRCKPSCSHSPRCLSAHPQAVLAAALRLAGRAAQPDDAACGSAAAARIGLEDFLAAARALAREFRDEATGKLVAGRAVNYGSVRSVLQETVYGGAMLDFQDALTVGAAADYWLSANSVKRTLKWPSYRIPPVFFGSQSSKAAAAHQALEQTIPAFSFDCAEGCHLQPSDEVLSTNLDFRSF
uniref:Aldedh domain-containing protein n=1 Tax=Macrostomum lignano TaxID=282301 RepID=A0A1I8F5M8_9PLAT